MSEELLQRDLLKNPEKIGKWDFFNIGATSVKALKEKKIIPNLDYGKEEKKRVDALIVDKQMVLAVIEYKKPSEFKTDVQKASAVNQELMVARKLKSVLMIATDTIDTVWVNVATGNRILGEDGIELSIKFDPKDENLPKILDKIRSCINGKNDQIKPKEMVNPTDLAKQIWQDVWSVSGATPENCLYTFIELFIFKYLSDLGVLTGMFSFDTLYSSFEQNSSDDVLETYAKSIRPKIKELFPASLIDKTTIINGTIFVSKDQRAVKGYSAVFKKVLGKFKDYGKLEHIDYDFKSKLFESFLKESISKKNWGQFFTPLKVVRAISEMAKDEIKVGAKICDPACGVGKFLLEPILTKLNQFFEVKNGKLISKIHIRGFDKGFDKDEQKTIILAKANMLIYFSDILKDNPAISVQLASLFNESFQLKTNSILGTLSETIENEFDLILTNPPYVTSGSSNLKDEIKKSELEYFYKQNAIGVEGLFVEWIIKALKPGGQAFIVIPDGILRRNGDQGLREYILDQCHINALISLPEKTFFTTLKKTYILAISKKFDSSEVQTAPVFSYLVSSIGESLDIDRIEISQNDLDEATVLYNQFKGAKSRFKSMDKRCRAIQPSWFFENASNSWILEDLWSDSDLVDLGIKAAAPTINANEFAAYLGNLTQTVAEYQSQIDSFASDSHRFIEVKITDKKYFKIINGALGLTKKEYAPLDSKNISDIPVYTATLNPVAFFVPETLKTLPHFASVNEPNISFASDGDGTAGTNIVCHVTPYYLNTSRLAFKVIDPLIDSEFIFFAIQNIKQKYGFNYKHKPTLSNIEKIEIKIPVDKHGKFDLDAQKSISEKNKLIFELKAELKEQIEKIYTTKIEL